MVGWVGVGRGGSGRVDGVGVGRGGGGRVGGGGVGVLGCVVVGGVGWVGVVGWRCRVVEGWWVV